MKEKGIQTQKRKEIESKIVRLGANVQSGESILPGHGSIQRVQETHKTGANNKIISSEEEDEGGAWSIKKSL